MAPRGRRRGPSRKAIASLALLLAACSSAAQPAPPAAEALDVVLVLRSDRAGFCSGTVLASQLVVTAAHCVMDPGSREAVAAASVRLGIGKAIDDPELTPVPVAEIRTPFTLPFKSAEELQGRDFAVLVPSHPLPLSGFGLPGQASGPAVGDSLTLIGFGEDRFGFVGQLHRAEVEVVALMPETFAYRGAGCLGHSGGPLLDSEGRLVAIASLGTSRHCAPQLTRIAQPLAPFADFLSDQLLRDDMGN